MPNQNEFRIKDMYSAAVLRCLKYPLIDLYRPGGSYVLFVFEDQDSTAEQVVQRHWDGQLKVNSRDFVECVRELKTRLYSRTQDEH